MLYAEHSHSMRKGNITREHFVYTLNCPRDPEDWLENFLGKSIWCCLISVYGKTIWGARLRIILGESPKTANSRSELLPQENFIPSNLHLECVSGWDVLLVELNLETPSLDAHNYLLTFIYFCRMHWTHSLGYKDEHCHQCCTRIVFLAWLRC